jgi:hypothetical protein
MTVMTGIHLETDKGSIDLAEILQQAPTVMLLLRHFGCPVCREHLLLSARIQQEIEALGFQLIGIGQGFGAEAQSFANSIGVDFPVYGDPGNQVYEALAMPRGNLWQVTLLPMLKAPIKALQRFRHVGKPGKDIYQLGGVAVFDRHAKLKYCFRARDSGEVLANSELLAELAKLSSASL